MATERVVTMNAEERLEVLRLLLYDAWSIEMSQSPLSGESEGDCVEREWRAVARAACEHICGKDENGNVIVPAEGAVAKAIAALTRTCDACRLHRPDRPPCADCDIHEALGLLRGK